MPPINPRQRKATANNQKHICPKCGFHNHTSAVYCEICFYPLDPTGSFIKQPPPPKPQAGVKRSQPVVDWKQELKQPSAIAGLAVLALAIALWINYFLELRPQYLISNNSHNNIALYDSMSQVKDVPSGLYSYGGALYFASLVANGMNDAMLREHSNFDLRYTKPSDRDFSYDKGIEMLLDGELSFAFNGRPLLDREYSQASSRGMTLQQVPIALDGIVFFGNRNIDVDGLNLEQVRDIFTGKITNWSQLGGEDLSIAPIMLNPQNIEILGLDDPSLIPQTTKYTDNYTLALRSAIAIPGSIAFTSASLAQEQELIKVFSLAAGDSSNYIAPFTSTGEPNLELFKNGIYPLTRRLFLVICHDGTPDELAGKAYAEMLISTQGQKIVKQSGFVPLYGELHSSTDKD